MKEKIVRCSLSILKRGKMLKEREEIVKASYGMLACAMALAMALLYWFLALDLKPDGSLGVNSLGNIKCYVFFIALFLLVFSMSYGILWACNAKVINNVYLNGIVGLGLLIMVGILILPFFNDVWVFPTLVTIICVVGGMAIYMKSIHNEKAGVGSFNVTILILIGGVLWGIAVATSNTFSPVAISTTYDVHHSSAYIDSIYNVYKHIEFHGGITDQYGHYGLLFYLPLKIFGFTTDTIAGVCGVLSGTSYILAMISFCRIVKSNTLRYLIIAVAGVYAIYPALEGIYWQAYPHRVLFPAITMFLVTNFIKSNKINVWKRCAAVLVMTIAVIWNFESGIVCCMAWAAFRGIDVLQKESVSFKTIGYAVVKIVCIIIIPVFGACGIVNLYNLACGGTEALLGLREFVGLVVDENYIAALCTPLTWGNMIYLHKVVVFLICLCWGILHNHLFGKKGMEEKAGYAVVTGIIGLGLMTYHVNRTASGDDLVNLFFVICLGLMLDGMTMVSKIEHLRTVHIYNIVKYVVSIYALAVLLGCSLQTLGLYQGYVKKYDAKAYSYEDFKAFAREVSQVVPQNTWAMGEGMSALYMELGWEKGTWGMGDIQANEIPEQDAIFISNMRYYAVPGNYKLEREFIYSDIAFGYFIKNGVG